MVIEHGVLEFTVADSSVRRHPAVQKVQDTDAAVAFPQAGSDRCAGTAGRVFSKRKGQAHSGLRAYGLPDAADVQSGGDGFFG